MVIPGRSFKAAGGYRYGFNGKENDNEVKGEGNQQDYGLRIYDVRIGRFLSADPLTAKYPFYSPYQFSGNDVIRCIDLDGGEPLSRTGDWDRNTAFVSGTSYNFVYDKASNRMFDVQGVVDPSTGKLWIVADDGQGQHQYFYLVNDDGATDKLRTYVENGRTVLYKSHFKRFETRNEKETKQNVAIARGFGLGLFGLAGAVSAGIAAPAALASLPSLGTATVAQRGVNTGIDYLSQVAGNYVSGKEGTDAWVGNINVTSLAVSAINPGTSIGTLAFNNGTSSAFSTTLGEGYNGLGGGKTIEVALIQAAVGTAAGRFTRGTDLRINQLTGRLQHVNRLFGTSSPLSTSLQSAVRNTAAVGATIGTISGGAGNAINNKVED